MTCYLRSKLEVFKLLSQFPVRYLAEKQFFSGFLELKLRGGAVYWKHKNVTVSCFANSVSLTIISAFEKLKNIIILTALAIITLLDK